MVPQAAGGSWLESNQLSPSELEALDARVALLIAAYLHRIADLEQQVRHLQAHAPTPVQPPREGPAPWREPHA